MRINLSLLMVVLSWICWSVELHAGANADEAKNLFIHHSNIVPYAFPPVNANPSLPLRGLLIRSPQKEEKAVSNVTSAILHIVPKDFLRYPAEFDATDWVSMLLENGEYTAFYRDVLVGQWINLYALEDSTFNIQLVRPDGYQLNWPAIHFAKQYGDKTDCWYVDGHPEPIVCGTNHVSVIPYTDGQGSPTGKWTFNYSYNGFTEATQAFVTLPQLPFGSMAIFNQHLDIFKATRYGRSTRPTDTISSKGCALVCCVAILDYHGIQTDPIELNTWLQQNLDGYKGKRGTRLNFIEALQGFSGWKTGGERMVAIKGYYEYPETDGIDLNKLIPFFGPKIIMIKKTPKRTHFVVAAGSKTNRDDYLIHDPSGGHLFYEFWDRYFGYLEPLSKFMWIAGPKRSIEIPNLWNIVKVYFYSPGELVITDPLGRKTGFDPRTGVTHSENPNCYYFKDDGIENLETGEAGEPVKELEVLRALEGEFRTDVIGTDSGTYGLDIIGYQDGGGKASAKYADVPISPGEVHTYVFNYSASPGAAIQISGGFDGKGQRPRDVNKFMSYVSPTQARTQLPPGTASYNLVVVFSQSVLPETFHASLNGQDITAQFTPAKGKVDSIGLNLVPGSRNVLILKIDGTTESGRIATDTDRLVFISQ